MMHVFYCIKCKRYVNASVVGKILLDITIFLLHNILYRSVCISNFLIEFVFVV